MTVMDPTAVTSGPQTTEITRARGLFGRLVRRPLPCAALVLLTGVIAVTLLAPVLAPYNPNDVDLTHVLSGPSVAHWLGTDNDGRDVLSRLMYGGRVSLLGTAEAVGVAMLLGIPVGLLAGYLGGRWPDNVLSRIADLLLALPALIVLLVVLAVFPGDETAAMIALGVFFGAGLMRVVRGEAIAVRNDLYVDAARVAGLSHVRILVRHILPRTKGPVIVQVSLMAAWALIAEAGFGFLGVGVRPPTASWGSMLGEARTVIFQSRWLLVPPGVLIGLMVLAFALVGDGLTEVSGERVSQGIASSRRKARSQAPIAPLRTCEAAPRALLSVTALTVAFTSAREETEVIRDVGFDIKKGETVGLVGESGCGKTVTARAIQGLLPANGRIVAGSVLLGDAELVGMSEADLRRVRGAEIAMIPQEPMAALDPCFTVGRVLSECIRRHDRVTAAQAKVRRRELLALVGLPDPAGTEKLYPHQLSGGMAQRVAIAIALAGRPQLLIADEPTTALDVTLQQEVLLLLQAIQDEIGMSILIVSHDWGVIAQICDRALVMYAGEIVECADVIDMFREPHHPYTLSLLEANPHLVRDARRLPTIPGQVPSPSNWPSGCHFHPRCRYATDVCRSEPVSLRDTWENRLVRCVHAEELATGARQ